MDDTFILDTDFGHNPTCCIKAPTWIEKLVDRANNAFFVRDEESVP